MCTNGMPSLLRARAHCRSALENGVHDPDHGHVRSENATGGHVYVWIDRVGVPIMKGQVSSTEERGGREGRGRERGGGGGAFESSTHGICACGCERNAQVQHFTRACFYGGSYDLNGGKSDSKKGEGPNKCTGDPLCWCEKSHERWKNR